jgi:hypothetical protein
VVQLQRFLGQGAYALNIAGRRAGFTNTTDLNDVVEFGAGIASIPTLTGVEPLEIVSSSANDTAAGTGVRTVIVTYLNAAGVLTQSPPVALNGVTPVALGFTASAIWWAESASVGSAGVAVGNVRVRIVAGAVEVERISVGGNRSLSGRITVPAASTAYVHQYLASAIASNQDSRLRANVDSLTRALVTPFHFQANLYVPAGTLVQPLPALRFPAGAIIKASTISSDAAATARCDVSFSVLILPQ